MNPETIPNPATHRSVVDVHLVLQRDDGHVLLAERRGGYGAGLLNVPGGKLEDGETVLGAAIREAREELAVVVDPDDVEFKTVIHHRNAGGETRVGFFFVTQSWDRPPINAEPDKCGGLVWADPARPPENTIGYTRAGLAAIAAGEPFGIDGWTTGRE